MTFGYNVNVRNAPASGREERIRAAAREFTKEDPMYTAIRHYRGKSVSAKEIAQRAE